MSELRGTTVIHEVTPNVSFSTPTVYSCSLRKVLLKAWNTAVEEFKASTPEQYETFEEWDNNSPCTPETEDQRVALYILDANLMSYPYLTAKGL